MTLLTFNLRTVRLLYLSEFFKIGNWKNIIHKEHIYYFDFMLDTDDG